MEEAAMLELWSSYDKKLNECLLVNKRNTEDITRMKIRSSLSSMKPIKLFTVAVGLLWVICGYTLIGNLMIHAFAPVSKFFLVSAAIQLTITSIAIVVYIYQLVLIKQMDVGQPVLGTQAHLARLKSSTLWVTRILFLQVPFWTTFYLSEAMFLNATPIFYIVQGVITLSFTYMALWLFFNIRYKNKDKKWFLMLFNGAEWTPVIRSMELLRDLEAYHTEE